MNSVQKDSFRLDSGDGFLNKYIVFEFMDCMLRNYSDLKYEAVEKHRL